MFLRFLVTRLVSSAAVMALVALITFGLVGWAPGSYLDELAANPQVSAATLAKMRDQYGLDQPFYQKFWHWSASIASGDFGYSFVYQRPVRALVGERLWNTVLLNTVALAIAWILGVLAGLLAAARRGSVADWTIGGAAMLLVATPTVVLSVIMLAAAAHAGLPVGGLALDDIETKGVAARILDTGRHLLLPATVVAAAWWPVVARHSRVLVASILDSPHILAARARGLGEGRILFTHALREALGPLTGLFGLSLSALLSASFLVEVVMAWPGIGQLTYDAVLKRDIFVVVDLVQLSALLLLVGNLLGDVLLRLLDPRVAES